MSIARLMQMGAAASTELEGAWDLSYAYYDPPTAWDIATSIVMSSFSVAGQEGAPTSVFAKPDGTRIYILGSSGDDINQYDLSTAWDITTASFDYNFSVSGQEGAPNGLYFRPDGLKFYIVGSSEDTVFEYDLTTAWDVRTASYLQGYSVASIESLWEGIDFKPDGTRMYLVGRENDNVYEFSLSTAWDVTSASYVQSFNVTSEDTSPMSVRFKPDGTKMYVAGDTQNDIHEYNLSTAWDISSASFVESLYVNPEDPSPEGIYISDDVHVLLMVGTGGDNLWSYIIGGFDYTGEDTQGTDVFFKPDGTKMYIVGDSGNDVNEYDLSTAWDASSAVFLQRFGVGELAPQGVFFKPDGTRMYVTSSSGDEVDEYSLSTAWDISSASLTRSFDVSTQTGSPGGVFFSPDGLKMYVSGVNPVDAVFEYDLSTAWNVSSATYNQSFSVASETSNAQDVFFKPDGLKMYVPGLDAVYEYGLTSAWDISTASLSQTLNLLPFLNSVRGMFFKPEGDILYLIDANRDAVFTYNLGVQ